VPAYAAIALLAGLTYAGLLAGRRGRFVQPLLLAGLLMQLGLLAYPLGAQIPTAADRVAGAELIARLRALHGPVIVLRHPWYATVAGKGTFAPNQRRSATSCAPAPPGARARCGRRFAASWTRTTFKPLC
jgi:hypothetical protein